MSIGHICHKYKDCGNAVTGTELIPHWSAQSSTVCPQKTKPTTF